MSDSAQYFYGTMREDGYDGLDSQEESYLEQQRQHIIDTEIFETVNDNA